MCKIRLISIALLTITYLTTAVSQPPAPKTEAPVLPILSPDEFKQTVKQLNDKTQQQLDATLASLLGSSQSMNGGSGMSHSSAPASAPAKLTPSEPETPAATSSPTTPTTTAPVSQGFNPYAN